MSDVEKILVSGLWFSGSSAVVDFLYDFKEVTTFHDVGHESQLINGKCGLNAISRCQPSELRDKVAGYVYRALGVDDSPFVQTMNSRLRDRYGAEYDSALCSLVSRLIDESSHCKNDQELTDSITSAISDYTEALCRSALSRTRGRSMVVLDNDPPGHQMPANVALDCFRNLRIVVVHRDPRDAFVDVVTKSKSVTADRSGVEKWCKRMRQAYQWLESEYENDNIVRVPFEGFVQSTDVRERVARFCGVSGELKKDSHRFVPEESSRNVGIHCDFDRKDLLEYIESELPAYCRPKDAAGDCW